MLAVQDAGKETALKQMSAGLMRRIEGLRIGRVRIPQRLGQGGFAFRDDDPMHMIIHQAIRQNSQAVAPKIMLEQREVLPALVCAKEHRRAPVAALRHGVRKSRNNDARQASHNMPMLPRSYTASTPFRGQSSGSLSPRILAF